MSSSIALCMIVKDEEATLERAIRSVKDCCDEIIIGVDSKSSDKTYEIAEKYATTLYKYEWTGDFSAARNEGLAKSNSDWNIILDGDEYYKRNHHKIIRAGIDKLDDKGYKVIGHPVWLEIDDFGNPVHIGGGSRLLRNGVEFKGKQHNWVDEKEGIFVPEIVIVHDRHPSKVKVRKEQRSELVPAEMEKMLQEDPDNRRALFYLAGQAYMEERNNDAILLHVTYLDKCNAEKFYDADADEEYQMRIQLAQCLGKEERYEEAIPFLHGCAPLNWRRNDHWNWLSWAHYHVGEKNNDLEQAKVALQYAKLAATYSVPDKLNQFVNYGFYSWIPYHNLALASAVLGHKEQALVYARKVLEWRNGDPEMMDLIRRIQGGPASDERPTDVRPTTRRTSRRQKV